MLSQDLKIASSETVWEEISDSSVRSVIATYKVNACKKGINTSALMCLWQKKLKTKCDDSNLTISSHWLEKLEKCAFRHYPTCVKIKIKQDSLMKHLKSKEKS